MTFSEKRAGFFAGRNAQWDEGGGRILLGDNTGHAVPQQVPTSWSLLLFQLDSLVYTSKFELLTLNSDLLKIRLAMDLSKSGSVYTNLLWLG